MKRVLLSAGNNRVSGVGASRVADDYLRLVRQIVNDFSFPLIAPLRSDNYDFHLRLLYFLK